MTSLDEIAARLKALSSRLDETDQFVANPPAPIALPVKAVRFKALPFAGALLLGAAGLAAAVPGGY